MKICNHNLLKIYYRKRKENDLTQKWYTLENIYYCDKCKEIIKIK